MTKYYKPPEARHFDYDRCYTWQKSFAWLPRRTVAGRIVWLKSIYQQRYYTAVARVAGMNFRMESRVEYGDVFDILKDTHGN